MQHLGGILEKKLSHPRFKEALSFGRLKAMGEAFFREKKLAADIVEFDSKTRTLTLKVSHPSIARELLGYQDELYDFFAAKDVESVERMRIITRFSR